MDTLRQSKFRDQSSTCKDADLSAVRSNDLLARSLEILKDIYNEGGCRYDFYGNCIPHRWMNKENHCPHVRARALFEEIEKG